MALRFKNTATRETLEKYKRGEEQFEDALKRFQEEEKKEKEGQEEKAVEEYIVEFIEKLENFLRFKNPFTNFLKRWYSNFDNIMNLVDSTVYYRGLDFVLVFIIVTFWFCLDSAAEHYLHNDVALSALRDQHFYHLGHHPKGMFRMPASF